MPGFDQVRPGQGSYLQRFQVTRARRAKSGRVGGELIEKRHQETRARELDDGALAAGEYTLHWRPELRRKCVY